MKKVNNGNAKLQFKKQAIANLSKTEMNQVEGGKENAAAFTTSYGNCSGFLCCHPDGGPKPTGDLIVDTIKISLIFI